MPRRHVIAARACPGTIRRYRECAALARVLGMDADAMLGPVLRNGFRRLMVRCRREGIDPLQVLRGSRTRKGEPPPFDPSVLERPRTDFS
ncbi:hypothetical protein PHYC_00482 [Phycisphaerales bacterium]|nr:hypothetical protein PHYC_00482 [Phycisphaerales bacterium]